MIKKYQIDRVEPTTLTLPDWAYLLDIQVQTSGPIGHRIPDGASVQSWWDVPDIKGLSEPYVDAYLWVKSYEFTVIVTGQEVPPYLHHVSTFQMGGFVGHVFCSEIVPRAAKRWHQILDEAEGLETVV